MKRKVFITFILASLLACGQDPKAPEKPTDKDQEQKTQEISQINARLTADITSIIGAHTTALDTNWDENAATFNLNGNNQLFATIQYTNANNTKRKYVNNAAANPDTEEDRQARLELYLAFGYNKASLQSFATIANRLAKMNNNPNKTDFEEIIDAVRDQAKSYYIDVYQNLQNKKDKLKTLTLQELESLNHCLQELEDKKIAFISQIKPTIDSYTTNGEVVAAVPGAPAVGGAPGTNQTPAKNWATATDAEIVAYLKPNTKKTNIINAAQQVSNKARSIAQILNKIK
ncbi:virulence associated lipoprotein [Borrelia persica]|uniref:virulence associated lipoprotein n=1 Tax=Borrelia persica TaxID=44448 RepID=UPI0004B01388|nr:virulence associated lipoprotein [Borrelia persica]